MSAREQSALPSSANAERLAGVAVGLAAAVPSLAWALAGPDFLTDDFTVAVGFADRGVLRGLWDIAFVAPVRPAAGPYYLLVYEVIRDHPVAQAALLAVANALAAVLVWHALRCVVRLQTATLAALVFAVVPNRGSTRLWFVTGSNVIALACVAGAATLLLRKGRPTIAFGLLLLGVLAYEGTGVLALLVVVYWWLQDRPSRIRAALAASALIGGAMMTLFLFSPKRHVEGPGPFEYTATITTGVFGRGFWGNDLIGAGATIVMLVVLLLAVVTRLPSFRVVAHPQAMREVWVGIVLIGAAALPFLVGGAPFAVRGIFDRNNLVPDVGAAVIVATLLSELLLRWRAVGGVASVSVFGVLATGNIQDVRDYRAAVVRGHDLVAAIMDDVDPGSGRVVVMPPFPGQQGVEQFILAGDLTAALRLREGARWTSVSMPAGVDGCRSLVRRSLDQGQPAFIYDRLERRLVHVRDPRSCEVS